MQKRLGSKIVYRAGRKSAAMCAGRVGRYPVPSLKMRRATMKSRRPGTATFREPDCARARVIFAVVSGRLKRDGAHALAARRIGQLAL
jgi:hypothetical protein